MSDCRELTFMLSRRRVPSGGGKQLCREGRKDESHSQSLYRHIYASFCLLLQMQTGSGNIYNKLILL